MKVCRFNRGLLGTAAVSTGLLLAGQACAQDAEDGSGGLEEIVVTAQKREQSVQDVPIAVTAIGAETLQANRIVTITDLTGLAPGLTISETAGASKVPSFNLRGAKGDGSVAGSDRQVPIYVDGVYISGSRGGIFDLPDISRIEVLRGPQGTLFGRNATAGAVSIFTRDPSGRMGVKAQVTAGNLDQYRFLTSTDSPQIGPFSAYVSFLHSEKRGDIRNLAAGQVWDRRLSALPKSVKIESSPNYLGSQNNDSVFVAVKFESGDFTTVYKYDHLWAEGTSNAQVVTGTNFYAFGPALGDVLTALAANQPFGAIPVATDGKRPRAVANGFSVSNPQRAQGHNVTSTWRLSDSLSVKNVFGFRKASIFGASALDGFSGLTITPAALPALTTLFGGTPAAAATAAAFVGSPFVGIAFNSSGRTKQVSDELQFNYESKLLTATVGGLWFHSKEWTNEFLQPVTIAFQPVLGGVIPFTGSGNTFNETKSIAGFAQFEFHATDQIDVVAGGRVTKDKKLASIVTPARLLVDNLNKTRFDYLLGVNYKPTEDILIYGKYSTAYLAGGAITNIPYAAETAKSWEAGIKSELLDRKVRANLALFHVKYHNVQQSYGSTSPGGAQYILAVTGDPTIVPLASTFLLPLGDLTAKGFELDVSVAPTRGLTFGGALSYTDTKSSNISQDVLKYQFGNEFRLLLRPAWTGNLWAQYDTSPISGDAYLSFRGDGRYQSSSLLAASPTNPIYLGYARQARDIPAYWIFNGRMALKDLDLGGVKTEVAVWGKNLGNDRSKSFGLDLGFAAAANFIPARTYGVDVTVNF